MWELFAGMEMPLVPVLARMEEAGIAMDTSVLREMSVGLNEQIAYLEQKAYDDVGHQFNLGSPPQLSAVLFEEIGLPKTRKTKQGYSTDAQSIEGLRGVHPIIDTILRWREMTKLRSTYIETLPGAVDPKDLRIHTTFDQAVAATGRLSSNNPNLQNIPVRSELGGQVRRAFVARDFGPDPTCSQPTTRRSSCAFWPTCRRTRACCRRSGRTRTFTAPRQRRSSAWRWTT